MSGNPSQCDDLNIFVQEQELRRRLVSDSCLPTLELDISGDDISGAAERIAHWLEETDRLWVVD